MARGEKELLNMNFDELLEWTMGWAWPVIVLLGVLMAWGIGRFLTWGEQDQMVEEKSARASGEACVCTCR